VLISYIPKILGLKKFQTVYKRVLCEQSIAQGPQTRGLRGNFVRPAMLFGNFQIINIYVAKCFEKICCEMIDSKLNDNQCGFRPGRSTTDHISLSSNTLGVC